MVDNIETRVTPALHPENIKSIDGWDEETAPVLGPTETAFSAAYEGIKSVHAARDASKRNPTWNEAQQVIHTQDFADKVFARVAKTFDTTRASLVKGIEHLEGELSQPVVSGAGTFEASDIRRHMKELPSGERMSFIHKAIEEGDSVTTSAVLGARHYLSGIDAKTQAVLTRMWHEKANPSLAKRLKVMQGARALIEQRAGLVFKELEKAVGAPPHKVKALRDAKTKSEQAFVLKSIGE